MEIQQNLTSLKHSLQSEVNTEVMWSNTSNVVVHDYAKCDFKYLDVDELLSGNGIPSSELKKRVDQQRRGQHQAKQAYPFENNIELQTSLQSQSQATGFPMEWSADQNPTTIKVYEDVLNQSTPSDYICESLRSQSYFCNSTVDSNSLQYSNELWKVQNTQIDSRQRVRKDDIGQSSTNQQHPRVNLAISNLYQTGSYQQNISAELSLSSADLALATIPGHKKFDPSKCRFSVGELRPQPIIRKSRKIYVPDVCKDEKYWIRRTKNNIAAKRSREARRIKENQIALRAAFLEKENSALKDEVKTTKEKTVQLLKKLSQYEQANL